MYNSYIKDYQKFRTCYNKAEEKYDLTVKKPSYASLTGNFAIVNKPQTLTLIIWPGIFMERPFEYGVIIYDKESKNQCMIYVDENMNYLEDKYRPKSDDPEYWNIWTQSDRTVDWQQLSDDWQDYSE